MTSDVAGASHPDQSAVLAHPLSYVRAERGWTYQALAEVVARTVGNMAADRNKAYRWERRGVEPEDDAQLALAKVLGVPAEVVRTVGWPGWLPVGQRPAIELPWTATNCLTVLHHTAGAAMFDRRGFLTLAAGALANVANHWLTTEPERLTAVLNGGRIDTTLVGCFEQCLPTIRHMWHTLGGESVQAVADAELRMATNLLREGSYTDTTAARLYAVGAELAYIAGFSSFNTGRHAAAERYFLAALRSAHTANDRLLGANILRSMSLQLAETGRPTEAHATASAAWEGSRNAPPRVAAMLAVRQAHTHAVLGQAPECERLLSAADNAMGHADGGPVPGHISHYDQANFCLDVGRCYTILRRHEHADRWLSQSVALVAPGQDISIVRALSLMYQADSVLGLGDVEHACALASQAVPSVVVARSARHRRRLTKLHARLNQQRPDVPAVAALGEQIRTLIIPAA
jgi:hypothetical protein